MLEKQKGAERRRETKIACVREKIQRKFIGPLNSAWRIENNEGIYRILRINTINYIIYYHSIDNEIQNTERLLLNTQVSEDFA